MLLWVQMDWYVVVRGRKVLVRNIGDGDGVAFRTASGERNGCGFVGEGDVTWRRPVSPGASTGVRRKSGNRRGFAPPQGSERGVSGLLTLAVARWMASVEDLFLW